MWELNTSEVMKGPLRPSVSAHVLCDAAVSAAIRLHQLQRKYFDEQLVEARRNIQ